MGTDDGYHDKNLGQALVVAHPTYTKRAPQYAWKMVKLLPHFRRERPNIWICLTTVTFEGVTIPSGARVYTGAPQDGVDFGQLLEQEYAAKK